ncbi:MAG: RDD family protein [Solirubrobacteraceae bacterium]
MSVHPPHTQTENAQLEAIKRLRGGPSQDGAQSSDYAGLVTRAIALAMDAAVVWGTAAAVGVTVGLGVSLLHLPSKADAAIAAFLGALGLLWSVAYFVFFWSSTGQTPGSRVMCIAVVDRRGRGALKPRRALVRFLGLCLAVIPLGAGIVIMLWDRRRRCLHDRIARTVVVYAPREQ